MQQQYPPLPTQERTDWRDLRLNKRHREWGFGLPALDIDFLEYDQGEPVALIEYVHEYGRTKDPKSSNMRALSRLGTRAGIPVFVVRYSRDFTNWIVTAMNDLAIERLPSHPGLTEAEYVEWLYALRGHEMPAHLKLLFKSVRR